MDSLRAAIGAVLSLVGLGFASAGAWIADVPVGDPIVDVLVELRATVREIPTYDGVRGPLVQRSAVLTAIGEAITEAER